MMKLAIGLYFLLILVFVVRGALKAKSLSDFALGNIGFSPWVVGLSLAASMTSAATFIINPGFIALYGISGVISFGIVLPLAAFVSLVILTKGFQKYGQQVQAKTLAQWIGNRYVSSSYALFFGFLSLLLLTFIVLINVGLSQVLAKALGFQPTEVLLFVVVFVFGYMMFGGANAMVYTNTIQALVMLLVAIILLYSGASFLTNGFSDFFHKLSQIDPNLVKWKNTESYFFRDFFEIFIVQTIIGIAIVNQPHIMTKALLLKNKEKTNWYLFTSISVMAIFFMVVWVGLYARLTFPDLQLEGVAFKMDEIIPAYVQHRFSSWVGIIVVIGLLSAGLSTLEGLIQSLSVTCTQDIVGGLTKGAAFTKTLSFNRFIIFVLAVLSYFLSYQQLVSPNLSVAIFAQNGVYAYFAAAFVPVFFGTFLKNVKLSTVWLSSTLALSIHFGLYYIESISYLQAPVKNPGVSAALGILSATIFGFGHYKFTKHRHYAHH